ncbi:MAG: helix-turn-helix transcriptional regulator [Roseimicrobium sp.]
MNQPVEDFACFVSRLAQSELFLRYRDAFGLTTGRTLSLRSLDKPEPGPAGAFPFCTQLTAQVEMGGRPIAQLALDAVRVADGEFSTFEAAATRMLDDGCGAEDLRAAQAHFQKLPAVTAERCDALRTMLKLFAAQLGEFAEKLFLQTSDTEPEAVRRARHYIMNHLTSPLALEEVASHAGVSPFHFCKIFKRATSMTFTDFVNRARVEHAKRLLLKPQARITEVAYDVGFQSLSQFNRSFRRVTTLSPTEFRTKQKPHRLTAA